MSDLRSHLAVYFFDHGRLCAVDGPSTSSYAANALLPMSVAHYCHIRLSLNEMSDHRREHAWPDRQQHFNLVHGGLLLRKSMREVSARREETSGFKKGLGAGLVH